MSSFTLFHTIISLVAVGAGAVVTYGLLTSQRLGLWTALYLLTAVVTSATGFGFQTDGLLPSHYVAILSLALLAVAILARYVLHLAGAWRGIFAICTVVSFYFLVFVGVVQAFRKIPSLTALAPTQSEPPFAIAQGIVLVIFIALAVAAARKFHPVVRVRPGAAVP